MWLIAITNGWCFIFFIAYEFWKMIMVSSCLNENSLNLYQCWMFLKMLCQFRILVIMALHRFPFFVIHELSCILGKESGVLSCCFLWGFEFQIVFLLDLLPLKKPGLSCYLTHSWKVGKRWINDFNEGH